MKILELTERELAGITYQCGKDAPTGTDPVEWFTARAAYDAEQMAQNADKAGPTELAAKIAALSEADRAEIETAVETKEAAAEAAKG